MKKNLRIFPGRLFDRQEASLLKTFEMHNSEFLRKVGYSRTLSSYKMYRIVLRHLSGFLNKEYSEADIPLSNLTPKFISDFETYLREQGCSTNTVWCYMIALKHIIKYARDRGMMSNDPFIGFRNHYQTVERGYLTAEELRRLAAVPARSRLEDKVRDLFFFAVFTGLSYIDLKQLKGENIRRQADGSLWIITRRQKTSTPVGVKLLEVPRKILEKLGSAESSTLFDVPSNNCCNMHLKALAAACGIRKNITFHMGRHTFATMSLSNGMPIETVSQILGHTNIKTTQIYAKITRQKVSDDLDSLTGRIGSFEKEICESI